MTVSPEVERLRAFLKKEDKLTSVQNFKLYNLMGVIRGNDSDTEGEYRDATLLIRSYVGFNKKTCSGFLFDYKISEYTAKRLINLVTKIDAEHSTSISHYVFHVGMAVKAIGKDELIQYIRDITHRERRGRR